MSTIIVFAKFYSSVVCHFFQKRLVTNFYCCDLLFDGLFFVACVKIIVLSKLKFCLSVGLIFCQHVIVSLKFVSSCVFKFVCLIHFKFVQPTSCWFRFVNLLFIIFLFVTFVLVSRFKVIVVKRLMSRVRKNYLLSKFINKFRLVTNYFLTEQNFIAWKFLIVLNFSSLMFSILYFAI